MGPIEFKCPGIGRLQVIGDRLHDGHDFVCRSNAVNGIADYIIFLDSRGISSKFDGSLAQKLTKHIAQSGGKYLLLCRPLELTTWATLINFMAVNKVNPSRIVTNMGFVDFTPKKVTVLQDAVQQVDYMVGQSVATSLFVQMDLSSSGEEIALYSMSYGDAYRERIEDIVKQIPTLIINTPIVDAAISLERKRPKAFYAALADSNEFNHSITGAKVVDLPHFDELLTYDAVHYTQQGHDVIFDQIKQCL